MPEIVSRKAARAAGLKLYFTGKPCPCGHVAMRRVSTWQCTECVRDAVREYKKQNREKLSAWQRSYAPEKKRVAEKRWRDSHKSAFLVTHRIHWHRRRARKRATGGTFTAADIREIRLLQKDRCAEPSCQCKLYGKGDIDHVVPLAKGGSNSRRNLQLLCGRCNARKQAHDPIDFARSMGRLL